MRNEPLTGYLLHHKPYQESRALYYFFTKSHGVVNGVGKKGMPLFTPIQLFANGKRTLKSFSQIQPIQPNTLQNTASSVSRMQQLSGQNLYAGFYLNEILWKLLIVEDPMPILWSCYQECLTILGDEVSLKKLKLLLRYFERQLFEQLGYAFSLDIDYQGNPIQAVTDYRFVFDEGFVEVNDVNNDSGVKDTNKNHQRFNHSSFDKTSIFFGVDLIEMQTCLPVSMSDENLSGLSEKVLNNWSRLHKQMIDHLFGYKPLKSRQLWQQQAKYMVKPT